MKLSGDKKETTGIIVIVVGCCIIFYLVAIVPAQKKLAALKKKNSTTSQELSYLETIAKGKNPEEVLRDLRKRSDQLRSHFATSEREVLSMLTSEAARLSLTVSSITPREKLDCSVNAQDKDKIQAPCQGLPITLKISGEFRSIARYLVRLEYDFPFFLNVKSLSLSSHGDGVAVVDAIIDVIVYMASPGINATRLTPANISKEIR